MKKENRRTTKATFMNLYILVFQWHYLWSLGPAMSKEWPLRFFFFWPSRGRLSHLKTNEMGVSTKIMMSKSCTFFFYSTSKQRVYQRVGVKMTWLRYRSIMWRNNCKKEWVSKRTSKMMAVKCASREKTRTVSTSLALASNHVLLNPFWRVIHHNRDHH